MSAAGSKAGSKVGSAPCNPPPIGWQALIAGPRGDCVALMRPADALAYPCGAWCGYRKHKKTGGRVRLPVSCVLAMFSGLVLESAPWGAVPISVSLSMGKPGLPFGDGFVTDTEHLRQLRLRQAAGFPQPPDGSAGNVMVHCFHAPFPLRVPSVGCFCNLRNVECCGNSGAYCRSAMLPAAL